MSSHELRGKVRSMVKVLVTGGTGALGHHIVETLLKETDATARIMSRSAPPTNLVPRTEWAQADLESGLGLAEAVHDIDVIIHAASDYLVHPQQADVEGTRVLLLQAQAAGVSHLIYISIVGIDRIPLPYYKHKMAAEEIIKSSGIPWSILRATQFHSLIDYILLELTKPLLVALLPTELKFQPVDASEVASRLVQMALVTPAGYVPEIGGPCVLTLGEMAHTWLAVRGLHPAVLPVRFPDKWEPDDYRDYQPERWAWELAEAYRRGYNTCASEHTRGRITWTEWVQRKYQESKNNS